MTVVAIRIYLVANNNKDNKGEEVRVEVWSGNHPDLYTYSHLEDWVLSDVAIQCRKLLEARSIRGQWEQHKLKSK